MAGNRPYIRLEWFAYYRPHSTHEPLYFQFIDANLARYNLNVGEFEVLAALARNPDRQLSPKELQKSLFPPVGYLTELID